MRGDNEVVPELAEIKSLLERGATEQARSSAKAFEGYLPASDDDWAAYQTILEQLNLAAQEEIMTEKYLAQCPRASMIRLHLVSKYSRIGRTSEAQRHLKLALESPVQTTAFWQRASQLEGAFQNWKGMMDAALKGLKLEETHFWLRMNYADALFRSRDVAQGQAQCARLFQLLDTSLSKALELARLGERWKIYKADRIGQAAFEHALAVATTTPSLDHWSKIIAFLKEKIDQPRIARACETAAALETGNPDLLLTLFEYALAESQLSAASTLGKRLLAVAPDRPEISAMLQDIDRSLGTKTVPSSSWWRSLSRPKP